MTLVIIVILIVNSARIRPRCSIGLPADAMTTAAAAALCASAPSWRAYMVAAVEISDVVGMQIDGLFRPATGDGA